MKSLIPRHKCRGNIPVWTSVLSSLSKLNLVLFSLLFLLEHFFLYRFVLCDEKFFRK
jgi:hypothetical protein